MTMHWEAADRDAFTGKGVQFGDEPMKLVVRHSSVELESDRLTATSLPLELKRGSKSDAPAWQFKWAGFDWKDNEAMEQSDSDTTASGPGTANTSLQSENQSYRPHSTSDFDILSMLGEEFGQNSALTPTSPQDRQGPGPRYFNSPLASHEPSMGLPYPDTDLNGLHSGICAHSEAANFNADADVCGTPNHQPIWHCNFGPLSLDPWAPRPEACDNEFGFRAAQLEMDAAQHKVAALQAELAAQHTQAQAEGLAESVLDLAKLRFANSAWTQTTTPFFMPKVNPLMQSDAAWCAPTNLPTKATASTSSAGNMREQGRKANQARSKSESTHTTVMLRNVPNDYTRDMLLELLDTKGFIGCYDFVYLPVDFKRKAGLGYAFVNFITHEDAQRVRRDLQGFSDWKVYSQKVLQVAWSTPLQGLAANIERYRNSPVMHPDVPDEYRPMLLSSGRPVRFPPPTRHIPPPSK